MPNQYQQQQSVFVGCPFVKQSSFREMEQSEIEINDDTIEATIDVCFHLLKMKNLTCNKLGPVQITLAVCQNNTIIGVPYQIVTKKTYKTLSKINMEEYQSSYYILNPYEENIVDEIVIFKLHVPIDHVETNKLKCVIGLETVDELGADYEGNEQDKRKRLDQVQVNFGSILYVQSYLPCLFQHYGISLQSNIYTHILGCKYNHLPNVYRHYLYQAIDHLVICYNKLRQKLQYLINHNDNFQQQRHQHQNYSLQQNKKQFLLPLYIDMKQYPEYQQIKSFIQKRIFIEQTMKEHKFVLQKFIAKFVPEMTEKLLLLWKEFVGVIAGMGQDSGKNVSGGAYNLKIRERFYTQLGLQLKRRIQYRLVPKHNNKRENLNYHNYQSQPTIHYLPQNTFNTDTSSLTHSQVFQNENYPPHNNHIPFKQFQYDLAQNDLKKKFIDKNTFQHEHKHRKLYLTTKLQLPYPKIKVCVVDNKILRSQNFVSHKQNEQQLIIHKIKQPHIIVLVHGLGASSNAFKLFQTIFLNTYQTNLYILNSTCNENNSKDESIQQMGRKLSIQVYQFISQNNFGEHFQLSFIGHSLGGLIIRSALTRLEMHKFNMRSYVTLSTPHLGYFFHNSTINKAGMWAISKLSPNKVLTDLLMVDDSPNTNRNTLNQEEQSYYRNSYLYQLSLTPVLSWFQHIIVCGSQDDYFVSPLSSLFSTTQSIILKSQSSQSNNCKQKIWQQMRRNIELQIKNSNIHKLLIDFNFEQNANTTIKDHLLGRKSHVMYLSSKDFMMYLMLVHKEVFQ